MEREDVVVVVPSPSTSLSPSPRTSSDDALDDVSVDGDVDVESGNGTVNDPGGTESTDAAAASCSLESAEIGGMVRARDGVGSDSSICTTSDEDADLEVGDAFRDRDRELEVEAEVEVEGPRVSSRHAFLAILLFGRLLLFSVMEEEEDEESEDEESEKNRGPERRSCASRMMRLWSVHDAGVWTTGAGVGFVTGTEGRREEAGPGREDDDDAWGTLSESTRRHDADTTDDEADTLDDDDEATGVEGYTSG